MPIKDLIDKFNKSSIRRVLMSGHGAYINTDGSFNLPSNITLHFYVKHAGLLGFDEGWAVENVGHKDYGAKDSSGGHAGSLPTVSLPAATEIIKPRMPCYNYRLYPAKVGWARAFNYTDSSKFNRNYITSTDTKGTLLSDLLAKIDGPADVHWTACRELYTP